MAFGRNHLGIVKKRLWYNDLLHIVPHNERREWDSGISASTNSTVKVQFNDRDHRKQAVPRSRKNTEMENATHDAATHATSWLSFSAHLAILSIVERWSIEIFLGQ